MNDGSFMLSCDKCEAWYHGHCVGVAENDTEAPDVRDNRPHSLSLAVATQLRLTPRTHARLQFVFACPPCCAKEAREYPNTAAMEATASAKAKKEASAEVRRARATDKSRARLTDRIQEFVAVCEDAAQK